MAHEVVVDVQFCCLLLIISLMDNLIHSVLQLLSQHLSISIFSTILHNKNDRLLLRGYQPLRYFYDRLEDMRMTALVPADLIHPHINDNHIGHGKTEQGDLFLYDFLFGLALDRVESFSVDDVQFVDVLKPYSFCAAFSVLFSVQNGKTRPKGVVH